MKILNFIKSSLLNDRVILAFILINTLCIFIEGFHSIDSSILRIAYTIDHLIIIVFFFEMVVKIRSKSWKEYISSGWNRMDFLLVMLSIPSLIDFFFDISFLDIAILMVFRLLRTLRFLRLIKFIPGIDGLIKGTINALKTSVLIIIVFMITLIIISMFSSFLFYQQSPEYFGNPIESMYSIFKIFTVEGWYEIPDGMSQNYSDISKFAVRFYFIGILFIGGIIGLSLLNSVFVDAMIADNNDDLTKSVKELKSEVNELKALLRKIDEKT